MMQLLKRLLKVAVPSVLLMYYRGYRRLYMLNKPSNKMRLLRKGRLIKSAAVGAPEDDYVGQFVEVCETIRIDPTSSYIYPFDTWLVRMLRESCTRICSITVDFGKVLQADLNGLKKELSRSPNAVFADRETTIIDAVVLLANRIADRLEESDTDRAAMLKDYFPAMLYRKPKTLDEAIQKLLFYDALFWQMGHMHIGLGRLDKILNEYYESDVLSGRLMDAEAKELLRQLILILGKDTRAKSLTLVGDTGQYILLGGVDRDGKTIQNRLTLLFLELFAEMNIPDPKLILRVNPETEQSVWRQAVRCILTGCGSPLVMNERPIMQQMIEFGYAEQDVFDVGTSACWEPLVIGKSFDQNNPFPSISPLKALNNLILSDDTYASFEELFDAYKSCFVGEIRRVVQPVDFDCSPLFSLFFDDCIKRGKDFSRGGATYAYHGAQVVGLPNAINALLNLKDLVYTRRLYSLAECKQAMKGDFRGYEDLRLLLLSTKKKYGAADREVVDLTNDLMQFVGEIIAGCSCNGQKVKVGFSSPSYIGSGQQVGASLDGRRAGEPLAVHISPVSSEIDIAEILDFATRLNYTGNRINGNVVDFILPSSYVHHQEKLIEILKDACEKGVFELQLNVLDKKTLLEAKAHPEKYPDLIVRVWGFSAYFNDLPEAYKDNLIRRAETYATA